MSTDSSIPRDLESARSNQASEPHYTGRALLSIDDGGVRYLVTLSILSHLMDFIRQAEEEDSLARLPFAEQRPHVYFDFVMGSGPGGVIAAFLGRLQMSVAESREAMADIVTGAFRHNSIIPSVILSKRDSAALEVKLKSVVASQAQKLGSDRDERVRLLTRDTDCNTAMLMYSADRDDHVMFRSYRHAEPAPDTGHAIRASGRSDVLSLWQLMRAALSRPHYFAGYRIHLDRVEDAGLFIRNPALELVNEVADLERNNGDCIDCLVSIGTGVLRDPHPSAGSDQSGAHTDTQGEPNPGHPRRSNTPTSTTSRGITAIESQLARLVSRPPRTKQNELEKFAAIDANTAHYMARSSMMIRKRPYFRLDVVWEPWELSLEDIESGEMDAKVKKKLEEDGMKAQLRECARMLVTRRRLRQQSMQHSR